MSSNISEERLWWTTTNINERERKQMTIWTSTDEQMQIDSNTNACEWTMIVLLFVGIRTVPSPKFGRNENPVLTLSLSILNFRIRQDGRKLLFQVQVSYCIEILIFYRKRKRNADVMWTRLPYFTVDEQNPMHRVYSLNNLVVRILGTLKISHGRRK